MSKKILKKKIGVIGLGYIGLPLLAALAKVGFKVTGIDVDKNKIKKLKKSYKGGIYEPGLDETLKKNKKRIEFTDDYSYFMQNSDVVFITVGTPFDNKKPNLHYLNEVVDSIGKNLKSGQLIILKSTVLPGVTRKVAGKLEKISKLRAGLDFYIVFCPERTVEGKALEELYTLPKIIGGINEKSFKKALEIIKELGSKIIKVSSLEVAEMCKFIDNTYRSANIAIANELGDICEKIDIDAYEVVAAVNETYSRNNLFLPALGAGGPCLTKDPQILEYLAKKNKINPKLINTCIAKNKESTMKIVPVVFRFIKNNKIPKPKISLIGLAFKGKPPTDDYRSSPTADIYQELKKKNENLIFSFYDPLIHSFFGNKTSKSLKECIKGSNVVMFLTNHPELMNVNAQYVFKYSNRPLLLVDCWHNLINLDKMQEKKVKIFRIGDSKYLKI